MRLYKRGNVWWAAVGSRRSQKCVSTGCADLAAARERAEALLAPAMLDREASSLARIGEAVRRMRGEARELEVADVPLEAALPMAFEAGLCADAKESTRQNAAHAWRPFARAMAASGIAGLGGLSDGCADEYMKGLPPQSRRLAWVYVRKALALLGCRAQVFSRRPARAATTHREPLTPEQIRTLLSRADEETRTLAWRSDCHAAEYALLLRVLLYTGLRLGDAATLRMDMIDRREWTVARTTAKTARPVRLPLHPALRSAVEAAGGREYLLPELAALYMRDPGAPTRHIRKLLRRCGIVGAPHQFCAHALRTTFASVCAERGVPLAVIQSWLGHTSQEVTRIYARVEDMRAKRAAMALFPSF